MTGRNRALLLLAAGLASLALAAHALEVERRVGIVPQYSPIRSAEQWQPLLDLLTRQSGVALRFATAPDISEFEERVLAGVYDYAFVNALLFQEAQRRAGYQALARSAATARGVIVVRRDGPTRLQALRDQTIAFPAPRALIATLLPRAELRRFNIPHHVYYLGTHESVFQALLRGQVLAGCTARSAFDALPPDQRAQLRILHQTAPTVAHVLAAHARVPAAERARLQARLLALHETPGAAGALKQLGIERLVPVADSDFAPLAGMRLPTRVPLIEFHVIPRLAPEATRQHMLPLAAVLKQRLAIQVDLKTYSNLESFERHIYQTRNPALINANPLQAQRLLEQGYEVIAQQLPVASPEGMRGIVLVRSDSPYQSLADLAGKRIAFGGGPSAFFATIVPKAMLKRAGLDGRYLDVSRPGPVADVLPRLAAGEVDAIGLGNMGLHNKELNERYIRGRMRVLAQSEPIPGLAWLLGPQLDADLRDEIRHLLLHFDASAPGHAAMQAAGIERLLPANAATYAPIARYLEELGIR